MKISLPAIATACLFSAVICFLSLSLSSCTRPPEAKKELLFAFWGSVEQQKLEQTIIRAFESKNPDIKIRILPIGQRYAEKIQAMMVADAALDIFFVEMARYDEWTSRGVLMDVTSLMETLSSEDALMPLPRKAFERNGHFYAVPISVHGYVMYCNLDALKKAGIPFSPSGWSWDQVREMALRLSRRHGHKDATTDYAILMPPLEVLLPSYGARFFDSAENPTKITANTPEVRAAFSDSRNFITSGLAAPSDVTSAQGTFELFRDGLVAFFLSGRGSTPEFTGKTHFHWDVVPVPSGPAGSVTMHGGTSITIWKKTCLSEEASVS